MNHEKLYLCTMCRSRVEKEHIRFDTQGIDLVCDICFARKHGLEKKKKTNKIEGPSIIEERRSMRRVREDVINYRCQKCNYKFARKASFYVGNCPFCSSSKVAEEISGKAQELIDSVDETSLY